MKLFLPLLMFVIVLSLQAQPTTITYQGKLLDNSNLPVNQTGLPITFAIYSSEINGIKLWPSGAFASKTIDVAQGLYSASLGTGSGDDEIFTSGLFGGYSPWLEVVVDGNTLPRTPLTNVPFSLIANNLSDAGWASPGAIGSNAPSIGIFSDLTVGSETQDLNSAKLKVDGGVLYTGGSVNNTAGLLFYDPSNNGNFKYFDNNGTEQILGTGDITYSGTLWTESSGDYVAYTDVIATSSLGVGFDMVPGYSFGFATIAMRENNTRILFEDTSVGLFPSHDWMLVANESSSGGLNYFAIQNVTNGTIPFYVHGDAGNNSLIVKNGSIGIGTNSPTIQIHTKKSDTPGIRFEQDNTSGFTAQTWDIAGNEANFFVRDVTNGTKLPFRIRPGAPTNSLHINSDGNIGLGISDQSHPLQLLSGAHVTTAGVWTNASDKRLKTNIRTSTYGLAEVLKLNPVFYNMRNGGESQVGFIAQEVKLIIPEVVSGTEGDLDQHKTLGLSYGNLVPVLTKAIQEQQLMIENLKSELASLKKELAKSQNLNESMIDKFTKLATKLTDLYNEKRSDLKTANN